MELDHLPGLLARLVIPIGKDLYEDPVAPFIGLGDRRHLLELGIGADLDPTDGASFPEVIRNPQDIYSPQGLRLFHKLLRSSAGFL